MRKVIVSEFIALDGVVEDPHLWTLPYWNDDMAQYKNSELMGDVDTLLLGRVTYEGFAAAWPERSGDDYSDKMNSMPKYVVSTTLDNDSATWNNSTVISENVVEEIQKLRQQPGGDILIFGSADLVNSLLAHGLIDELHLQLYPIVLGSGKRLFQDGLGTSKLELVDSKTTETGVNILTYRRASEEASE